MCWIEKKQHKGTNIIGWVYECRELVYSIVTMNIWTLDNYRSCILIVGLSTTWTEILHTPRLTWLVLEPMTFWSWQYSKT